jgi:hypothetical protein
MIEVQGNSLRLYLEGLMFFALNEEQNRFEAGILNIDDGHTLSVRGFSRRSTKNSDCSDEVWEEEEPELIPDKELQLYEQGEVTILGPGDKPQNISSPLVPRNRESWMPFSLIPDIEDILERKVRLIRSKVKPVLGITGANFFSVLRPDHLEPAIDEYGFIRTYRLEKDQVLMVKTKSTGNIESLEDLIKLGAAVKELAIRAYTAATIITLNKGQELVCVLKGDQAQQRLLFRVKYDPDREAKVAIQNAVSEHVHGSEVHPHHGDRGDDPKDSFHFLHFYDAIKNIKVKEKYFLASEEAVVKFLSEIQARTGGDDPFCPAIRIPSI